MPVQFGSLHDILSRGSGWDIAVERNANVRVGPADYSLQFAEVCVLSLPFLTSCAHCLLPVLTACDYSLQFEQVRPPAPSLPYVTPVTTMSPRRASRWAATQGSYLLHSGCASSQIRDPSGRGQPLAATDL
jgi:hypothetical protein